MTDMIERTLNRPGDHRLRRRKVNETLLVSRLLCVHYFAAASTRAKGSYHYAVVVLHSQFEWTTDCLAAKECRGRCFDLRCGAGCGLAGAKASLSHIRLCSVGEVARDQLGNR